MRQYGLPHGWPYQPSTICGPETPRPAMTRLPPASASTVAAAIAADAGGRAASCMMPVPSRIRFVSAARYASGVMASVPYASAVHTESNPSRSASSTLSTGSVSSAPEYPMFRPSFMRAGSCAAAPQAAVAAQDHRQPVLVARHVRVLRQLQLLLDAIPAAAGLGLGLHRGGGVLQQGQHLLYVVLG